MFQSFQNSSARFRKSTGRGDFRGQKSWGRMARIHVHSLEGDGDWTRCTKSMDCVSFTTSEPLVFWCSSKTVVLASDGFGALQSLTCSTSVEDRGTGRSWQPKEPLPFWSFWSCLKKNDMRVACSVTACSCHRECLTKLPSFDLHVVFRLEAE